MVSGKSREIIERMEQGRYVNSRAIPLGGAQFSARDVLVKAPLMARLNAYFVGGTGRGKSQLLNEMVDIFGNSACYMIGRPDFELSELLKQVRLDKLSEVKTDRELMELTENVNCNFYGLEEMNRTPPIIQNYFLDFGEGRIMHLGKVYPLGTDGYSVLWATGNLGDGEYVGVSDSDRALKDRMHIIVKADHSSFRPQPLNMADVYKKKKNEPRLDMTGKMEVTKEDVLHLHRELMEREINPVLYFLGVYLTEGLDYLQSVKGHSKMDCDTRWPSLDGIATDNDENKIFPLSPRSVISSMALAGALEMIAEAKDLKVKPTELFIEALRLTVPYSGVISPAYIEQSHNGSAYAAFDSLFGKSAGRDVGIRADISRKIPLLEEAVALAEAGMTDDSLMKEIAPVRGKWTPVIQALKGHAKRLDENPTEESLKYRELVERTSGGEK